MRNNDDGGGVVHLFQGLPLAANIHPPLKETEEQHQLGVDG
jgi:hypothetical protein